jgi:hypothetical protein
MRGQLSLPYVSIGLTSVLYRLYFVYLPKYRELWFLVLKGFTVWVFKFSWRLLFRSWLSGWVHVVSLLIGSYRRFGGTCCLHKQGGRVIFGQIVEVCYPRPEGKEEEEGFFPRTRQSLSPKKTLLSLCLRRRLVFPFPVLSGPGKGRRFLQFHFHTVTIILCLRKGLFFSYLEFTPFFPLPLPRTRVSDPNNVRATCGYNLIASSPCILRFWEWR